MRIFSNPKPPQFLTLDDSSSPTKNLASVEGFLEKNHGKDVGVYATQIDSKTIFYLAKIGNEETVSDQLLHHKHAKQHDTGFQDPKARITLGRTEMVKLIYACRKQYLAEAGIIFSEPGALGNAIDPTAGTGGFARPEASNEHRPSRDPDPDPVKASKAYEIVIQLKKLAGPQPDPIDAAIAPSASSEAHGAPQLSRKGQNDSTVLYTRDAASGEALEGGRSDNKDRVVPAGNRVSRFMPYFPKLNLGGLGSRVTSRPVEETTDITRPESKSFPRPGEAEDEHHTKQRPLTREEASQAKKEKLQKVVQNMKETATEKLNSLAGKHENDMANTDPEPDPVPEPQAAPVPATPSTSRPRRNAMVPDTASSAFSDASSTSSDANGAPLIASGPGAVPGTDGNIRFYP